MQQDELGREAFQEHPQQAIWCQGKGDAAEPRPSADEGSQQGLLAFATEGSLPLLRGSQAQGPVPCLKPTVSYSGTTVQKLPNPTYLVLSTSPAWNLGIRD